MGLEDVSLPAVPRDDDSVGRGLLQRVTFHSIPLYTRTWKPNFILSGILAHSTVKYQGFKSIQHRGLKTTFKDYEMARVKQGRQVEPKLSKSPLCCYAWVYYTVGYTQSATVQHSKDTATGQGTVGFKKVDCDVQSFRIYNL